MEGKDGRSVRLLVIVLRKQGAQARARRSALHQPLPLARPHLLKDPRLYKKLRQLRATFSNT